MTAKEHYEYTTRDEAWQKAKNVFPFDFEKDESASERAGYPVYRATRESNNNSWISDLGTLLELNIVDGKDGECKTINIWINDRKYTASEVREIVKAQRNELEAINAIRLAAEVMQTHAGEVVTEILKRMEYDVKAKLEEFGF